MTKTFLRGLTIGLILVFSLGTSGCYYCLRQGFINLSGEGQALVNTAIQSAAPVESTADEKRYSLQFQDTHFQTPITYRSDVSVYCSNFCLFCWLEDPLVIQMPADVTDVAATYQIGSAGPKPFTVQAGLSSLPVTPAKALTPEPGQQLVLITFPEGSDVVPPPGQPAAWFLSSLTFRVNPPRAISVKCINTGIMEDGGQKYYIPLLPRVSDFSQVPSITIPLSNQFEEMVFPTPAALPTEGEVTAYGFGPIPPKGDLNSDWIRNRLDYELLAAYLDGTIRHGSGGFSAPLDQADLNGDALINAVDLVMMLQ